MTTSIQRLGRLKPVALREAWPSESLNFTPWLAQAENLTLLGEAVGMQLELEADEQPVGLFRADILCKNVTDDSWVLIENQLERTDHMHLGQLLTYAAGLNAVALIWIAERFTDEHRAALDWINDQTAEGIGFFGLEIELWRIGDSEIAPSFNVVCQPNGWTKKVVQSRTRSEFSEVWWDYWTGVLEAICPSGILAAGAKAVRKQDILFPVGWRNFWLKAYFSRTNHNLGVWVSCRGPRGHDNFLKMRESKTRIEREFGGPLDWNSYEAQNRGTCFQEIQGCDPQNREDWPRQHSLLADKLVALYRAVAPLVAELDGLDEELPE